MQIDVGYFYFIKDSFFDIMDDPELMKNKESGNKRPCYYCIKSKKYDNIIWFIPVSTKIEKYFTKFGIFFLTSTYSFSANKETNIEIILNGTPPITKNGISINAIIIIEIVLVFITHRQIFYFFYKILL